jgi:hypothetical protein
MSGAIPPLPKTPSWRGAQGQLKRLRMLISCPQYLKNINDDRQREMHTAEPSVTESNYVGI